MAESKPDDAKSESKPDDAKSEGKSDGATAVASRSQRIVRSLLGLAVGAVALSLVWAGDQFLQPHAAHLRARTALGEVNETLRVLLDRRRDLSADMKLTDSAGESTAPGRSPGSPPVDEGPFFPYRMNEHERTLYRQAAVRELYDINLRIASLIRRGNELVETLDGRPGRATASYLELCKDTKEAMKRESGRVVTCPTPSPAGNGSLAAAADRLFDAAVTAGSYSQTVYRIGALGLILLGYVAIGTAFLSGVGAFIDIPGGSIWDIVSKLSSSSAAAAGTVVAGVVGASALAAGVSAATFAKTDSPGGDEGIRREILTLSCASGSCEGGSTTGRRDPLAITVNKSGDINFEEQPVFRLEASESLLQALSTLTGAVTTLVVRTPSATHDPELVRAIGEAAASINKRVDASATVLDKGLGDLSTAVHEVHSAVGDVSREQGATRAAIVKGTAETTTVVKSVATTTENVVNHNTTALSPIVIHSSCLVNWQKSLQERNGFHRFWHVLTGYHADPCDQKKSRGDSGTQAADPSQAVSATAGDRTLY
jgi:hypothetical protein